jgi:hypothetical protein
MMEDVSYKMICYRWNHTWAKTLCWSLKIVHLRCESRLIVIEGVNGFSDEIIGVSSRSNGETKKTSSSYNFL